MQRSFQQVATYAVASTSNEAANVCLDCRQCLLRIPIVVTWLQVLLVTSCLTSSLPVACMLQSAC